MSLLHVDDYLDGKGPTQPDPIAKEYLEHARRPAVEQDKRWLRDRAPFVTWRGVEYRCVGASRMGDVWLKETAAFGGNGSFYDKRIDVAELSDWRWPPAVTR